MGKFIGIALLFVIVQVALIVAKLTNYIDPSWWWIFTPIWAPVLVFVVAILVAIALLGRAQSQGRNPFN